MMIIMESSQCVPNDLTVKLKKIKVMIKNSLKH